MEWLPQKIKDAISYFRAKQPTEKTTVSTVPPPSSFLMKKPETFEAASQPIYPPAPNQVLSFVELAEFNQRTGRSLRIKQISTDCRAILIALADKNFPLATLMWESLQADLQAYPHALVRTEARTDFYDPTIIVAGAEKPREKTLWTLPAILNYVATRYESAKKEFQNIKPLSPPPKASSLTQPLRTNTLNSDIFEQRSRATPKVMSN